MLAPWQGLAALSFPATVSQRRRDRMAPDIGEMFVKLGRSPALFCCSAAMGSLANAERLKTNDSGCLARPGLNVMAFGDFYPDGHQAGVTVVQHGARVDR